MNPFVPSKLGPTHVSLLPYACRARVPWICRSTGAVQASRNESSFGRGGVSDEALAEAPRRAMTSTAHRHEIGGSGFGTTPELLSEGAEAREGGVTFGSLSRQNLGRSKPDEGDTAITRLHALLSLPGSLAGKKDGPLLSSSAAQGVNCRNGPARSGKLRVLST